MDHSEKKHLLSLLTKLVQICCYFLDNYNNIDIVIDKNQREQFLYLKNLY